MGLAIKTSRTNLSRRAFIAAAGVAAAGVLTAGLAGCSSKPADSTDTAATAAPASDESAVADKGDNVLGLVTEGKLTIGSDCDYPPFISMDGEQPQGFEYDLLEAICAKLGIELNFLAPQKFDTLVASIVAGGKMDLAVSSITITDARQEEVDFCDPYCDSNQSISVMADSAYASAADLTGCRIAVQSGTTGEAWAKENIADAQIVPFDDQSSAFAALVADKADAVALDLPIAQYMVASAYSDCKVLEEIPTGEQYGFAVSKDNNDLRDAVNGALKEVRDDGTYDKLYAKYFG